MQGWGRRCAHVPVAEQLLDRRDWRIWQSGSASSFPDGALAEAGRVVGIGSLDYVRVGDGGYVTLRERGHVRGRPTGRHTQTRLPRAGPRRAREGALRASPPAAVVPPSLRVEVP